LQLWRRIATYCAVVQFGTDSTRPMSWCDARPSNKVCLLRPERVLLLERLVRHELILQRHLAAGRRSASARMSAIRQARRALLAAAVPLPLLKPEAA
jgi:hypothetical protein